MVSRGVQIRLDFEFPSSNGTSRERESREDEVEVKAAKAEYNRAGQKRISLIGCRFEFLDVFHRNREWSVIA